jgi:hypothetical protein
LDTTLPASNSRSSRSLIFAAWLLMMFCRGSRRANAAFSFRTFAFTTRRLVMPWMVECCSSRSLRSVLGSTEGGWAGGRFSPSLPLLSRSHRSKPVGFGAEAGVAEGNGRFVCWTGGSEEPMRLDMTEFIPIISSRRDATRPDTQSRCAFWEEEGGAGGGAEGGAAAGCGT